MNSINKLIIDNYNPLPVLKEKVLLTEIKENFTKEILNNLSYIAYIAKSTYRKTGYRTFYAKFIDKNSIFRNAFVNGKLNIINLGEKNLVSFKHLGSLSLMAYDLMKVIIENFEKDLCSNTHSLIVNDDRFQQIRKELNKDIKYFIHKDLGTNKYPSLSIQKYEINIIFTKISETKKSIYKISQEDCNKLFSEKKIDTYLKFIQWLNTNADKCYAKIVPIKITIGLKSLTDIIPEDLLNNYKIEFNQSSAPCVVFNSHFEAIIIYNINKKFNSNSNAAYMNEENIDDDYIFANNITEETLENMLNTLKVYNINYVKNTYSMLEKSDIDLADILSMEEDEAEEAEEAEEANETEEANREEEANNEADYANEADKTDYSNKTNKTINKANEDINGANKASKAKVKATNRPSTSKN
jgi:hypothetical protein